MILRLRRSVVLVVAFAGAMTVIVTPAVAASGPTADSATDTCVVNASPAMAVRAVLTPGTPVAEDAAFNRDDPDAEDSPLELIQFPDESDLWEGAGLGSTLVLGSAHGLGGDGELTVPEVRAFAFTGSERQDHEVSDSIVRLYCGLFDREPNPSELEYWVGRYWNGLPLVTIAEAFTHAQEFIDRYGVVSDTDLASLLYRDVLGREPAPGGIATAVDKLANGDMHRGELIVQFTESSEYVARTGTVPPVKPTLPYPDEGSGRRIILSESQQRVWLVEATGELYNTHQVSGRRGIPGVGRYRVYSKSRYAWAPHDGITMEYMVRFARKEWPYGFHSIPVWPDESPLQTPAQLGTFRSGGCVRQLWDDAAVTFGWAEVGDRVVLIP